MAIRENLEDRKKRARRIVRLLRKTYPDADCALEHHSAFELLIATILSAQSTDVTINKVAPGLFARYPDAKALAEADPAEVEEVIHATGFFRQKTKSILGTSRALVTNHGGDVPDCMEDLVKLPGVARKTANVVLGTWFGRNDGVVVDTHVGRIADRLALAWRHKNTKDAVRIERDLMEVVPQKEWTHFAHTLILLGRQTCSARRPNCADCPLRGECPAAEVIATELSRIPHVVNRPEKEIGE